MRLILSGRLLAPGAAADALPHGFQPERAHPAFNAREAAPFRYLAAVQAGDAAGLRWRLGPLVTDQFAGDTEPAIEDHAGPRRNIVWQPLFRTDVPAGWRPQRLGKASFRRIGFAHMEGPAVYDRTWTQHARRHKRRWEQQTEWTVRDLSLPEFLAAYKQSPKDPVLKFMMGGLLKKKVQGHGPLVRLVGAVRRNDPSFIGAGFAFTDVPELAQSVHTISFVRREAMPASAGTGLIDAWFQHCAERGIRWLNFGNFWAPGDPAEWIGFSEFKAQFGVHLVDRPFRLSRRAGRWFSA